MPTPTQTTTRHTVYCNPLGVTAWLVYEGKEDPNYESVLYTNRVLETEPENDKLYQKPCWQDVLNLLCDAGLYKKLSY